MMTLDVVGQVMSVTDEERAFVDQESGKSKTYQKRTVRALVGSEFVVLTSREGVQLPEPSDVGKKYTITLSAFSNEKDIVRGNAIKFIIAK